jgi:hypothetical protein
MKLGNLPAKLGLTKSNLMEGAKLGAGAALFPVVYNLIRENLLLKASPASFAQGTVVERVTRMVAGLAIGATTRRMLDGSFGDGMVASAIGSVASEVMMGFMSPAASAAQAQAQASEQVSGLGAYSASNPIGRLAGPVGAMDQNLLFGVGTPNMAGASMFNGATVAVEETGGFSGATVAIEPSGLAGIFQ